MSDMNEKKRIIIVDDEPLVALVIKKTLQHYEYDICGVASTGENALALIHEKNPHLILMDIYLAGAMDGITTVTEIKKKYDIPIIYITASTDPLTIKRAKMTLPAGFMVKPIRMFNLVEMVDDTLHASENSVSLAPVH
jgi:DNA-binding NarL/FixJ family response regulator